jgi:hypothetical protein
MKVGPRMDVIVPGIVETKIKKELKEITSVHLREHTKEVLILFIIIGFTHFFKISQNISNKIRGELESRSAIERRLKMNPKRL